MRLRKVKVILFFSVLLLSNLFIFSSWAEKVFLKNGKVLEGDIIYKDKDKITINYNGIKLTYFWPEISNIEGEKIAPVEDKAIAAIFNEVAPGIVAVSSYVGSDIRTGTGFVLKENGVIVTSLELVVGVDRVSITLSDGRVVSVTDIMDYSIDKNVAVLKAEVDDLPVLSLGNSDIINKSDSLLVIGVSKLDFKPQKDKVEGVFIDRIKGLEGDFLKFKAVITDKMQGAPLLDRQAKVIGLVNYIMDRDNSIALAVPINDIKQFFNMQYPKMGMEEFVRRIGKQYYLVRIGLKAYALADFNSAVKYLSNAIAFATNCIEAYRYLGNVYVALDYVNDGIDIYKKAIALDQENSQLYTDLGLAYLKLDNLDDALISFQKAVDLKANNSQALSNLGHIYYKRGLVEDAVNSLQEAIRVDSTAYNAYTDLGVIYLERNDTENAFSYFKKSIEREVNNPEAYYNLSLLYFKDEKYDLAVHYCDQARKYGKIVPEKFMEQLQPYRQDKIIQLKISDGDIPFTQEDIKILHSVEPETNYYAYKGYNGYFYEGKDPKLSLENMERALARLKGKQYDVVLRISIMIAYDAATYYKTKNMKEEAIKFYEQVLSYMKFLRNSEKYRKLMMKCYYDLGIVALKVRQMDKVKKAYSKLRTLGLEEADNLAREIYELSIINSNNNGNNK